MAAYGWRRTPRFFEKHELASMLFLIESGVTTVKR